uniref:Uncharacterized protein n=1 Tax=Ditylenchus dipsaci TaxID=166011 RepID=A0A915EHT7_9BILA
MYQHPRKFERLNQGAQMQNYRKEPNYQQSKPFFLSFFFSFLYLIENGQRLINPVSCPIQLQHNRRFDQGSLLKPASRVSQKVDVVVPVAKKVLVDVNSISLEDRIVEDEKKPRGSVSDEALYVGLPPVGYAHEVEEVLSVKSAIQSSGTKGGFGSFRRGKPTPIADSANSSKSLALDEKASGCFVYENEFSSNHIKSRTGFNCSSAGGQIARIMEKEKEQSYKAVISQFDDDLSWGAVTKSSSSINHLLLDRLLENFETRFEKKLSVNVQSIEENSRSKFIEVKDEMVNIRNSQKDQQLVIDKLTASSESNGNKLDSLTETQQNLLMILKSWIKNLMFWAIHLKHFASISIMCLPQSRQSSVGLPEALENFTSEDKDSSEGLQSAEMFAKERREEIFSRKLSLVQDNQVESVEVAKTNFRRPNNFSNSMPVHKGPMTDSRQVRGRDGSVLPVVKDHSPAPKCPLDQLVDLADQAFFQSKLIAIDCKSTEIMVAKESSNPGVDLKPVDCKSAEIMVDKEPNHPTSQFGRVQRISAVSNTVKRTPVVIEVAPSDVNINPAALCDVPNFRA